MTVLRGLVLAGAILGIAPVATGHAAPARVVSMNLCTDQLAMLLAEEDQLVSVSYLARDERASAMAEEAERYPVNHGLAEEIFLLDPDLVIAGQFTSTATVAMLRRLGIPVVTMAPAYSLDDVRKRLTEMGKLLGREAAAAELVAKFDADLAALRDALTTRPRAAIYSANGYTSGPESLAGAILDAAGFDNVAKEAGLPVGGLLPLERLVLLDPDVVVLPQPYPGASRSEEVLHHPAVLALRERASTSPLTDRDWICGTPHVLNAIKELVEARQEDVVAP
ncbi:cobalamin ABC transporter substrate-binding protein [Methyloceanibacter stevinii]|uniref:Cobalamin ABC transporter substrate-binding protein n=1 Tax=Methyloceanibacter stevinii TaxID=1774970 RepID=A0A1E3VNW9_9HYPH|nr:ABC transporter substrate-binding protein [Methyloceanibacter stevinii]ODR95238.1 cobalamin ABC transporter substrate-binding protein [Methyloceanibacter stevinii]